MLWIKFSHSKHCFVGINVVLVDRLDNLDFIAFNNWVLARKISSANNIIGLFGEQSELHMSAKQETLCCYIS